MNQRSRETRFANLRLKVVDDYADGIISHDELLARLEEVERKRALPSKPNWAKLRAAVWERDEGICQVCCKPIDPSYYECGHIVDRAVDGKDEMVNLLAMCNACNRAKPIHATRGDFFAWR